jgi:hypothetical protein
MGLGEQLDDLVPQCCPARNAVDQHDRRPLTGDREHNALAVQ